MLWEERGVGRNTRNGPRGRPNFPAIKGGLKWSRLTQTFRKLCGPRPPDCDTAVAPATKGGKGGVAVFRRPPAWPRRARVARGSPRPWAPPGGGAVRPALLSLGASTPAAGRLEEAGSKACPPHPRDCSVRSPGGASSVWWDTGREQGGPGARWGRPVPRAG